MRNPFEPGQPKPKTEDGLFSRHEVGLANRNSGALLETLTRDITPTGTHYLLTHFDVPMIDETTHRLCFEGAFEAPFSLDMDEIRGLPVQSMPVTLECAGNGRSNMSPRSHSMPWHYEAVGTSEWTGTPLAPLITRAKPLNGVVDFAFLGADAGFDKGVPHAFGRSLTPEEIDALDVLLVWGMNGAPLLPQHGAPLRIIVPGWYGMASVKWLTTIRALTERYDGFQQVQTYRFRKHENDPGEPVNAIRVKSLLVPPGVPDWITRERWLREGPVTLQGRAWSGNGVPITRVEVLLDETWQEAHLTPPVGRYAWTGWTIEWAARPGRHMIACRATDANGATQPLEAPFDMAGFANNVVHRVTVHVAERT
ncbi:molybdopterin-dependent oxidoreductase [Cognatishimia sp. F0-27]|uniref:molybdopterin-dependent oxidoreductase n=1 Tax=Cognatishimia sp. F0-27 TaxID=2816855 RepID=UPI001D0C952A|nr:molybdopterin-dependent oxidoreductase [Cognatishimia sp. F0-27]MCC1492903.1 molybdopterin-dependent oxidoreductase [Cognatishimia sp. F0-27]